MEAAQQRQHKARFAGAKAPFVGRLPEQRRQQILATPVQDRYKRSAALPSWDLSSAAQGSAPAAARAGGAAISSSALAGYPAA